MREYLPSMVTIVLVAGCSSGTDITRTDDEVEEWVAEQKTGEGAPPELPPSRPPADAAPRAPADLEPEAQAPRAEPAAGGAQGEAQPAAGDTGDGAGRPVPCSNAWNDVVEGRLSVLDAQGHGPDIGSPEWRHAVERKLGVQSDQAFPEPGTEAWCERVDQLVFR